MCFDSHFPFFSFCFFFLFIYTDNTRKRPLSLCLLVENRRVSNNPTEDGEIMALPAKAID